MAFGLGFPSPSSSPSPSMFLLFCLSLLSSPFSHLHCRSLPPENHWHRYVMLYVLALARPGGGGLNAISCSTHVCMKLPSISKDLFPKSEALVQMIATGLQTCVCCKAFSCLELRFAIASTFVGKKTLTTLCHKVFKCTFVLSWFTQQWELFTRLVIPSDLFWFMVAFSENHLIIACRHSLSRQLHTRLNLFAFWCLIPKSHLP